MLYEYQGNDYTHTTLEDQKDATIEWPSSADYELICDTMICIDLKEFDCANDLEDEVTDLNLFGDWEGAEEIYRDRVYGDTSVVIDSVDTRYVGHDNDRVYIYIEFNTSNH